MKQEFIAELKKAPDMDATYIEVPFDVEQTYGKKRVKIKATIDGFIYCGSLVRMDKMCPHFLLITQAVRKAIGKSVGEQINITLELDSDERVVELPQELAELLKRQPVAEQFFNNLSYTNRKEYVQWLLSAKRPETKANRLQSIIEKLLAKKKNPGEK